MKSKLLTFAGVIAVVVGLFAFTTPKKITTTKNVLTSEQKLAIDKQPIGGFVEDSKD